MAAQISCEQLDDVKNKLSCGVAPEVIGPSSGAPSVSEICLEESILKKIAETTARKAQSLIYKVHKQLRNVNKKAYAPQIISIGPYHRHHRKDTLKLMEEHKLRYLEQVIQSKPIVKVEDYIAAVEQLEQAARDCYAEPLSRIKSPNFIEMLVLDGCFIIELLRKDKLLRKDDRYFAADNDPLFQTLWIQNSLKRDMMLLENQIPFFVLCKLFDLIEGPNRRHELVNLVKHFFWPLCPGSVAYSVSETVSTNMFCCGRSVKRKKTKNEPHGDRSWEDVKHILDLLHSRWSPPSVEGPYFHLIPEGTRFIWRSPSSGEYDHVDLIPEGTRIIKSATELRNANVELRVLGDAETMLDVDFTNGALSIPPITIKDPTECILRNLIAYEQYFPIGRPTPFTDYAVLLDCLVNTSADVKLLSEIGIFKNKPEDNEAVAKIFNRITHSVTLSQLPFLYEYTFTQINDHHQKHRSRFHEKKNRAIAKLKQDYFNSPWAYISFFAAFLLLLLTIAQTVFSAVQLP